MFYERSPTGLILGTFSNNSEYVNEQHSSVEMSVLHHIVSSWFYLKSYSHIVPRMLRNNVLLWEFQDFSIMFLTGFLMVLFKVMFSSFTENVKETFHNKYKKTLVTFRQHSKNVIKKHIHPVLSINQTLSIPYHVKCVQVCWPNPLVS
jgi:hypothetical protein